MKALLIDDERLARVELRRLLLEHPHVEVVGEAANVSEGHQQIAKLQPDLLFLDIEMPGGSGFDLLAALEDVPAVIFTTAYDAYALRAFEVNALDYLLKPVDERRLAAALQKVALAVRARSEDGTLDRVFVRDGERCFFVRLREVPIIESVGNYSMLYLPTGRPMVPRSLNQLESRLDPTRFFRASRKHLVNLDCIDEVEPGPAGTLVLRLRGTEIEMSRRQSQRFRELMTP